MCIRDRLQDMAEGKTLDDAETEYVKIFANLKDFEKAQQKLSLIHIWRDFLNFPYFTGFPAP